MFGKQTTLNAVTVVGIGGFLRLNSAILEPGGLKKQYTGSVYNLCNAVPFWVPAALCACF